MVWLGGTCPGVRRRQKYTLTKSSFSRVNDETGNFRVKVMGEHIGWTYMDIPKVKGRPSLTYVPVSRYGVTVRGRMSSLYGEVSTPYTVQTGGFGTWMGTLGLRRGDLDRFPPLVHFFPLFCVWFPPHFSPFPFPKNRSREPELPAYYVSIILQWSMIGSSDRHCYAEGRMKRSREGAETFGSR